MQSLILAYLIPFLAVFYLCTNILVMTVRGHYYYNGTWNPRKERSQWSCTQRYLLNTNTFVITGLMTVALYLAVLYL